MILSPITLTFPFSSPCHLCKPEGTVAMNFKELRSHQGLFLLDEILKEEKGCIVEISTLNNELKKCGSYSIFPPFLKLCRHFECWNVFLMDKDFFLHNEHRKKKKLLSSWKITWIPNYEILLQLQTPSQYMCVNIF